MCRSCYLGIPLTLIAGTCRIPIQHPQTYSLAIKLNLSSFAPMKLIHALNHYFSKRGASPMSSFRVTGGRRSIRVVAKMRANLIIANGGVQRMLPCLIVDKSREGFRLRGDFRLRRGQVVELVVEDPVDSVKCEVIWIGKPGSQQAGEAGLQTVGR